MKTYNKENFKIKEYSRYRRPYSIITLEGLIEEIIIRAAELLEKDNITPMYEHMRLKIKQIKIDPKNDANGMIMLIKSNYAGD
jgi:hypothetical protein